MAYPETGEFVLATIKKIMPYGAFCSLDEYQNVESFIHVSEVSSGWVRNIREHLREGQKIVAVVTNVVPEKRQIDVSLKRVSEADKKRKMEAYKSEKRAEKLLERAAIKVGKNLSVAMREIAPLLEKDHETIWGALEAASKGELKTKLPKVWMDALEGVAKLEIKPQRVELRAELKLQSFGGNGLADVKAALAKIKTLSAKEVPIKLLYLGAPSYYVDVEAGDYKTAEKMLDSIRKVLGAIAAKDFEWSLEKKKE